MSKPSQNYECMNAAMNAIYSRIEQDPNHKPQGGVGVIGSESITTMQTLSKL